MSNRMRYGFVKPAVDAHTMGITSVSERLTDCGYEVIVADERIGAAASDYRYEARRQIILDWIREKQINHLGFSYRLDTHDAVQMMGYLLEAIKSDHLMIWQGGPIHALYFGGVSETCRKIAEEFKGEIKTFVGGETAKETLLAMGVREEDIPRELSEGSRYDDDRISFGEDLIASGKYKERKPVQRPFYPEFGTKRDTVVTRLAAWKTRPFAPLIRAHVGPYSSDVPRMESVNEFLHWAKLLAKSGHMDILSVGSSQLSQSHFGEDWKDLPNGGGVPVNSEEEYAMIREAARPLLVRTYAGTKNIPALAQMYEKTLNISWHALSLWWFNRLDSRGPYGVYENLKQHFDTTRYIAATRKPFEANVSHHFAFRGADDVTYIVSAVLAARLAKKLGIRTFVLQNMLNTPRLTWGIQDLAKSRAMLRLVRALEDDRFTVILQPRAGLDYFKPDLHEAKAQLAAVTALMDDIEPDNDASPEIIHVVSYSEAVHLATPDIIEESIQITQQALTDYRELRRKGAIPDMGRNEEIKEREQQLLQMATERLDAIENAIPNPYTPEGFYKIFAAGFLPVPYLWGEVDEFPHAKNWKTKPVKGGIRVVDENGMPMKESRIAEIAISHIEEANRNLIEIAGKNNG